MGITFFKWHTYKSLLKSIIIWSLVVSLLVSNTIPAATSFSLSYPQEISTTQEESNASNKGTANQLNVGIEVSTIEDNTIDQDIENTQIAQATYQQDLSCDYLGGIFPYTNNQCDSSKIFDPTDPSKTIVRSMKNSITLYGAGQNPNNHIKYICREGICPPATIYYSISCSFDWTIPDQYSTASPEIQPHGEALDDDYWKSCGTGKSGSCSLSLSGKINNVNPGSKVHERISSNVFPGNDRTWNCDWTWSFDPLPLEQSDLSNNQPKNGNGDQRECELSQCNDGQTAVGDPINPLNGNFDYSLVDLSVNTVAGPLTLQRSYASQAIDTTQFPTDLGTGWTHNQDIRLILGTDTVWFKGHTVNQYLFTKSGTNVFEAFPGVTTNLLYQSSTNQYILTTRDKSVYIFDSAGKLLSWRNALGYGFDYSYQNGKLSQVSEPVGQRFIQFEYVNGKLSKASDNTGRFVTYGYTGNNLTSFTDARTKTWIYEYQGIGQRLSAIKDPSTNHKTILSVGYNDLGRAVEQYDGLGKPIVKIQYSPDGNPGTRLVTDALNRQTIFEYNDQNLLVGETDSAGYSVEKSYYPNLRLWQVQDQDQRTTSFEWSSDGANLTKITDAEENTTELQYLDSNYPNHVTLVRDPGQKEITYSYNGPKLQSSLRHTSSGVITNSYTYTTTDDLVPGTTDHQPVDLLKTVTDDLGHTTTFIYDQKGQLKTIKDAKNKETHFVYDQIGRVIDVTNPLGRTTHYVYDPAGNITQVVQNYVPARQKNEENQYNLTTDLAYDEQGRLYLVTNTLGHTTTVIYDDAGRIFKTLDAYGKATTYGYNDAGQLTSISDPLSHKVSYEYDTATGRLLRVKDNAGRTTQSYTYNPDSTVYSITQPKPIGNYVLTYQYDDLKRVTSVTDNAGHSQGSTYDPYGNPLSQTDSLGRVTHYEYNDLGLLWKLTENYRESIPADNETNVVTEYGYDTVGNLKSIIDANNHVTTFDYTELNQLWKVTDPLQKVTEFGYDDLGNRTTVKDAKNNITTYGYDLADRLHSIDYPGGLSPEVTFHHDALGRLTGMDDPIGHTTWVYNNLSRITSITDPYNKTIGYGYDDDGKRTSITYPSPVNRTITYQYNALDQLEHVLDGQTRLADYTYDTAGQLLSTTRGNGIRSSYGYDLAGQTTGIFHWKRVGQSVLLNYEYDNVGNPTHVEEVFFDPPKIHLPILLKDSSGSSSSSSSSQMQSPDLLQDGLDATLDDTVIDPYPAPIEEFPAPESQNPDPDTSSSTPEGSSSLQSFFGWVVGIFTDLFKATTPIVSAHSEYQEGYPPPEITPTPGAGGGLPPITPAQGAQINVIDYTYDSLNRLTGFSDSAGRSYTYTYDKVGNRETQTVGGVTTTYGYDDANRLTSVGGVNYSWDDNGNLLNDGVFNYGYDFANRLVSASDGQDSYTFAYDGIGNRYEQAENGTAIHYTLDLAASLPQVLYDGSTAYYYGLERIAQQTGTTSEYFLTDALGSVRQITNGNGAFISNQSFDPFGVPISPFANPTDLTGTGGSVFGYAGEQTDDNGLQYLRARYYSPSQGRFLTRDPFPGFITQPATLNAYAYAGNSPVLNNDPSGMIAPLLAIAGLGFVAGAAYNAYQQTDGFSNWCGFDIMQSLAWGVGGAAAAASIAILSVGFVGMVGVGLQGAAFTLYSLGFSGYAVTGLWTGGMAVSGVAAVGAAWLFSGNLGVKALADQQLSGYQIPNGQKLLPAKAGPVAHISPSEVVNRTPQEINDRAIQLGLQPMGPDPMMGKGAYVDPQTGVQRILVHPNSPPYPHGHINNALGQRIDSIGNIVLPNSPDAHLLILFIRK